jgi:hypothetical protein
MGTWTITNARSAACASPTDFCAEAARKKEGTRVYGSDLNPEQDAINPRPLFFAKAPSLSMGQQAHHLVSCNL